MFARSFEQMFGDRLGKERKSEPGGCKHIGEQGGREPRTASRALRACTPGNPQKTHIVHICSTQNALYAWENLEMVTQMRPRRRGRPTRAEASAQALDGIDPAE